MPPARSLSLLLQPLTVLGLVADRISREWPPSQPTGSVPSEGLWDQRLPEAACHGWALCFLPLLVRPEASCCFCYCFLFFPEHRAVGFWRGWSLEGGVAPGASRSCFVSVLPLSGWWGSWQDLGEGVQLAPMCPQPLTSSEQGADPRPWGQQRLCCIPSGFCPTSRDVYYGQVVTGSLDQGGWDPHGLGLEDKAPCGAFTLSGTAFSELWDPVLGAEPCFLHP